MIEKVMNDVIAQYHSAPEFLVMDVRPSAAFNGWALQGKARGGHIPGAVSFPRSWFSLLATSELNELLNEKQLGKEKQIIIASYNEEDAFATANKLQELGFQSLSVASEGMVSWLDDVSKPVQYMPRYQHLIHPEWLAAIQSNIQTPARRESRVVIAHVNFDNWGDYVQGHIPGAIWLDTLELEDEYSWNARSPEELREALKRLGITYDTTVVLYGQDDNPNMSQEHPGKQAGQIAAMRAALLLMYAGVEDVRILDGGLSAWRAADYAISETEINPEPVSDFGVAIPAHSEYIVNMEEAKAIIQNPNAELVSARSWKEYIGEVSGYHYIDATGRIPGAVFGNCGSDAYHMENLRNPDGTMKSQHEIMHNWAQRDITPEKHIAFYCGTGWRASEAFFAAWLMGWMHISIYDGGWYEWSSIPENPIVRELPGDSLVSAAGDKVG